MKTNETLLKELKDAQSDAAWALNSGNVEEYENALVRIEFIKERIKTTKEDDRKPVF